MRRIFPSILALLINSTALADDRIGERPAVAAIIEAPAPEAEDAITSPQARGVLKARQSAEIAAGMSGRLLSAPYQAGAYFKKGARLAKFDCQRQDAELVALSQAHKTLTLKYENIAELFSAGAAGQLEVSIAKSEMEQAAAEKTVIQAQLKDCNIYAPYAGYVAARHVQAYETPAINTPLYSVIRAGRLDLSVIAPSSWMRWVKPGTAFEFKVDETGDVFTAKVVRLGAAVDPASQTIELTAHPKGKVGSAKAGMSGMALFSPPNAKNPADMP